MPNYRVREWILSLVMSPEHAAAVVGDMVEDGRSTFRCWTAIASHIRHALTPGLLGLVVAGFFAQFLFPVALAFLSGFGFGSGVIAPSLYSGHWRLFYWAVVLIFSLNQFVTGYWIGRWGRRSLLLALLVPLADCGAGALSFNTGSVNMALWAIPLLAGTIVYRRRCRSTPIQEA